MHLTEDVKKAPSIYSRFIRVVSEYIGGTPIKPTREVTMVDMDLNIGRFAFASREEIKREAIKLVNQAVLNGLVLEITKFNQPEQGMAGGNYIVSLRDDYPVIRASLDLAEKLKAEAAELAK